MDGAVIQSALALRELITRAPREVESLGGYGEYVFQEAFASREDFLRNTRDQPELRSGLPWALAATVKARCGRFAHSFVNLWDEPPEGVARRIRLRRPGCPEEVVLDAVSADELRRMYAAAAPAAFGDLRSMETRVDPLVRAGREIGADEFSVAPELCAWVAGVWAAHFLPAGVRAEPYKLNLYGPGDRFAPHRDTPEQGLVGTFLLALSGWGPPCEGGGLVVQDAGGIHVWDGAAGWAAFIPYLAHEVKPVVSGARVTLAFKVFATGEEPVRVRPEAEEAAMREVAERIAFSRNERGEVGVLLSFAYSLECTALCGRDRFLHEAMLRLGRVESLPVAVHLNGKAKTFETEHWFARADVHPLTPENLARMAETRWRYGPAVEGRTPPIPFLPLFDGDEVYSDNEEAVPFAGNYANPARVDTLYVQRALVLTVDPALVPSRARVPGIDLAKVDLSGRDLRGADLTGVDLRGTDLRGAVLEGAVLAEVRWDGATCWPAGFDPRAHGAPEPVAPDDPAGGPEVA
jgi:hypothetical protein